MRNAHDNNPDYSVIKSFDNECIHSAEPSPQVLL